MLQGETNSGTDPFLQNCSKVLAPRKRDQLCKDLKPTKPTVVCSSLSPSITMSDKNGILFSNSSGSNMLQERHSQEQQKLATLFASHFYFVQTASNRCISSYLKIFYLGNGNMVMNMGSGSIPPNQALQPSSPKFQPTKASSAHRISHSYKAL